MRCSIEFTGQSKSRMSKIDGSLILKEQAELEAAPLLFSKDQLPKVDKTKPRYNCTGQYLFENHRERYDAVVRLLVEPGVSIRSICRELHVADDTVRAVKEREQLTLDAQKKTILQNIAYGMRLASERVIELMPEASARDALIGVGILGDKMALLSGEPTVRIEVGQHIDFDAAFAELRRQAEETMKRVNAQVIDGVTDLDSKNLEQKALMVGDHQRSCGAENDPKKAVIDVAATSIADEPATLNAGQI